MRFVHYCYIYSYLTIRPFVFFLDCPSTLAVYLSVHLLLSSPIYLHSYVRVDRYLYGYPCTYNCLTTRSSAVFPIVRSHTCPSIHLFLRFFANPFALPPVSSIVHFHNAAYLSVSASFFQFFICICLLISYEFVRPLDWPYVTYVIHVCCLLLRINYTICLPVRPSL